LRELQQILLAELQHRVRNILAVTRSIISRSNDGGRSTDDYVAHLQGRISALARTQVLLTRSAGALVDLETLIRDELVAQTANEDQISLDGEEFSISPKSAEVLTLAIHELATNATEYGAFSRPSGRLEIRWWSERRDEQDWLVIGWRERGVPIIDAVPRRRGFGSELISRRIPYELRGRGSFSLQPGGVESRIEFPLVAGDSILQTDAGGR
jgi:two-component sensor histidine kinase